MSRITLPPLNLEFLKTLKGFASIILDPSQTDSVFDIVEGMRNTEVSRMALEHIKSKPETAQLIEERYIPATPDLDALMQYPSDSLGYIHASSLKAAGFDPEFYRKLEVKDDLSYVMLRLRQSHDIWHTVTGMGTDSIGELGLQAFSLAQTHMPLAIILIAGGLLKTLRHPENLDRLLDQIAIGYRMGTKAKPFLAQKWEDHWEKPLAEWRSDLNLELMTTYVP